MFIYFMLLDQSPGAFPPDILKHFSHVYARGLSIVVLLLSLLLLLLITILFSVASDRSSVSLIMKTSVF